ncbi:MAG TPA: SRPBCC domain-containing protein [Acidimicrobiales bacterium]
MYTATIEREIRIDAPIDVVWDVITNPKEIVKWFADEAEIDLRPGGTGFLKFVEAGHLAPLEVVTVEPPHKFSYRWNQKKGEQASDNNSMLVEFILSEDNGATILHLVEGSLDAVAWSEDEKTEYFNDHTNGWTHFGDRLNAYILANKTSSAK